MGSETMVIGGLLQTIQAQQEQLAQQARLIRRLTEELALIQADENVAPRDEAPEGRERGG